MTTRTLNLAEQLIEAASLAGAYAALERQHPDARGIQALADKWHARVTALCGQVRDDQAGGDECS